MSATSARACVALVVFVLCLLFGTAVYSQEPFHLSAAKAHDIRTSPARWSPACTSLQTHSPAASDAVLGRFPGVSEHWILDDLASSSAPDTACLTPPSDTSAPAASVDIPCNSFNATSGPCRASFVPFQVDLTPLGKPGEKIARARQDVLSILSTPNVCSAWFEQKAPDPASTFRTISYEVDKHGPDYILQSRLLDGLSLMRQPYAARVTQDGGSYSVITINAEGAFYRSRAFVLEGGKEEGPVTRHGVGDLRVGSYQGATLEAQMLTLLHEFGHIIDLLPHDGGDMDGTSIQNTNLVLRNCREEIEAQSKPNARATPRLQ